MHGNEGKLTEGCELSYKYTHKFTCELQPLHSLLVYIRRSPFFTLKLNFFFSFFIILSNFTHKHNTENAFQYGMAFLLILHNEVKVWVIYIIYAHTARSINEWMNEWYWSMLYHIVAFFLLSMHTKNFLMLNKSQRERERENRFI
jgi:hypothetical protein